LEHRLAVAREGDFDTGRDLLLRQTGVRQRAADRFNRAAWGKLGDRLRRFAQDAEQHVLRLDRETAELGRLVSSKEQDAARRFGIALEHGYTVEVGAAPAAGRLGRARTAPTMKSTIAASGPRTKAPAIAASTERSC